MEDSSHGSPNVYQTLLHGCRAAVPIDFCINLHPPRPSGHEREEKGEALFLFSFGPAGFVSPARRLMLCLFPVAGVPNVFGCGFLPYAYAHPPPARKTRTRTKLVLF